MRGLGGLWREVLLLVAVMLPLAALPALGFVWLYERGLALVWLAALLALSGAAFGLRFVWAQRHHGVELRPARPGVAAGEAAARDALAEIVSEIDGAALQSTDALRAMTERVVRGIASAYHPDDPHAALRVTVPEVLLMTERFATRLRTQLLSEVPLLARAELTLIPQGLSLGEAGGRLWDAWRVVRLADPLGALLQEARAVLINAALSRLSAAGRDRVAALLAREIGEVAIDLYAGRFRRDAATLSQTAPALTPDMAPGPVTVLLGGQPNAGKSSLVNALAGALRVPASLTRPSPGFTAHRIGDDLVLVDTPGINEGTARAWLDKAMEADLVLWVARAHDIARGPDRRALDTLRAMSAQVPNRPAAPIVLALTHADRLPPPRSWNPPYDMAGNAPKVQSFRAALGAARASLDLDHAVILRADTPETAWNLDALRAALAAALPHARARQLDRALAPPGWAGLAAGTFARLPGLARRVWTTGTGGRRRG